VAYRGPLLDTMMATEILLGSAAEHLGPIAEISRGGTVAVAVRETTRGSLSLRDPMTVRAPDAIDVRRRLVRGAATASYLLVIGTTANEPRAALIKLPHPAVSCRRHDDMAGSELYDVRLAQAPVQSWHDDALACWPRLLAQARIRQAAYLVGLSQGALDLATARAAARRQFGQPIGKFQAVSFRLAEAATRIEATRWFVRAAAWEADNDADARLSAAQALAMAADVASSVTLTGMQVHGAFASTRECDAQIYCRRAQVERVLLGGPAQLRAEALPLLLAAQSGRHHHDDSIRPAR
jgi:butyryl-CoA dehydrogenase